MLFKLCFKGRKYSATDSFSLKLYGSHRAYHLDGSEEEGLIRWLLSPERQQVWIPFFVLLHLSPAYSGVSETRTLWGRRRNVKHLVLLMLTCSSFAEIFSGEPVPHFKTSFEGCVADEHHWCLGGCLSLFSVLYHTGTLLLHSDTPPFVAYFSNTRGWEWKLLHPSSTWWSCVLHDPAI